MKSFIICSAQQSDQNRENEVSRPSGTYRREEMPTRCWRSLKRRDHVEDRRIDGGNIKTDLNSVLFSVLGLLFI
jgi:hypothetical protein